MEIKNILTKYEIKRANGPNSERSYWIKACADLAGFDVSGKRWWSFAQRFNHLTGKEGLRVIKGIYEDAIAKEGEWKRITFWTLLKKTK